MKKVLSVILTAVLLLSLAVPAYAAENDFGISYPTKAEILEKAKELNIDFSAASELSEPYSLEAPDYAPGKLSDSAQQQALNVVNFYRYIAGLPSDVTLDESYCEMAQAAALVNAANGSLSHSPTQPEGMSDELYQLGNQGAGSSNISYGRANLQRTIVQGWMDDSSAGNIPMLGHRRWVLYPYMQFTGFGATEKYYAMYSFDGQRSGRFTGDYVAWPAPNTPLEMFSGSVFSISLGDDYDAPSAENVSVTVTSKTLGKSWTVSQEDPALGFYVNNQWYGTPKCVIFKVADFNAEDTVHVTVNGITKNGVEAPIDYTVNLFSVSDISSSQRYVILHPYYSIVEPEITVSSLFDSNPAVTWRSTDGAVADMFPGYGLFSQKEGEATVTASVGGKSVSIPVISSNYNVLLGDADKDNDVTSIDATTIQRVMAYIDVNSFRELTADVDADGEVTVTDATQIQRWLADMDTSYPIGEAM